ncbi:MAG: hypothetical protein BWY57_03465 [Betaproteobacteria bacterium ADurb.Bin341]|nr:MAG: hypothetical protein BWY57_03465 [Betaproteobacteria bacterium ADurb.Bin341]
MLLVDVRLIPHGPVAHLARVTRGHGLDPPVPGREPLLGGRETARQIKAPAARIDGIAVAGFQKNVQPHAARVTDDRVKPGKVIHAFGLFSLGPSPLQADGLDPQRHDVRLVLIPDREIAVQRLATQRPIRARDLIGAARPDRPDLPDPRIQRGFGALRRSVDGGTARREAGDTRRQNHDSHLFHVRSPFRSPPPSCQRLRLYTTRSRKATVHRYRHAGDKGRLTDYFSGHFSFAFPLAVLSVSV